MKSVLISIQPYWVFLIIAKTMGWNIDKEKTVEVRKNYPKSNDWNKVVKIYCSKDKKSFAKVPKEYQSFMEKFLGKVIGEFVCDCIANYEAELWDDETFERIQEFFEPDDFNEYGEYEFKTIADNSDDFWKENMLCKSSCVTIEELRKYLGKGINEFYSWGISNLVIYDKPKELCEFYKSGFTTQEELEDELCAYCERTVYGEHRTYGTPNGPVMCEGRFCGEAYQEYLNENFSLARPPQSWCYVESE